MMTTKNNSRPRSPQQKMSSLTGSKNAKIMNLTSYIFSGFFQNKSSSNSNENEVRSAPEQRDAYKIHSKRSSGETVIGKSRVQQAIAYQDNPNTNFAMNVSGPSNRSVLSTSRPDGTIQAKNIRSVKVSQSASSHMKHSIPIAGSAASSPSNSSHGHSSNLNNNINKPLFSQNKVVHPSISVNDHDDRSVNSITVTRKSSSVPIGSFLSTTTTNSSSSTNITVATATTTNAVKKVLCCDKCDGKHETDDCPYYKKKREDHPDAQRNSNHKMGGLSLLPGSTIMRAKVVKQPGDGSCLFHSMCYGLGTGINASRLRSEICSFIQNNPDLKISDTPLKVSNVLYYLFNYHFLASIIFIICS